MRTSSLQHAALPHTVIVVEDSQPFRRWLCSLLRNKPELRILCEVSDGVEATKKAEELQPDLILLDIGLPTLNGIEVARNIRERSPKSRILFVSQESSEDVVQQALRTGARGYVVKREAANELLPAIDAVLKGKQFLTASLAGHYFVTSQTGASEGSYRI